jgi:hypothetical protein
LHVENSHEARVADCLLKLLIGLPCDIC